MRDEIIVFKLYAIQAGRNDEGNWEKMKVVLDRERVVCRLEAVNSPVELDFWLANTVQGRMWMPPYIMLTWVDEDTCDVTDRNDDRPLYTFKKLTPGPIETFFFHC